MAQSRSRSSRRRSKSSNGSKITPGSPLYSLERGLKSLTLSTKRRKRQRSISKKSPSGQRTRKRARLSTSGPKSSASRHVPRKRRTRKSEAPSSPGYAPKYEPAPVRTERGDDTILVKPGTKAEDIKKLVDNGWEEVRSLRDGTIFKNETLMNHLMEADITPPGPSAKSPRRKRRADDGLGAARIFQNAIRNLQKKYDDKGLDAMLEEQRKLLERL